MVVCRSSCFLPEPRTQGVGPRHFVVGQILELEKEHGISGYRSLHVESVHRQLRGAGGSVAPTGPCWENPTDPLSPLRAWLSMVRSQHPWPLHAPLLVDILWHDSCAICRRGRSGWPISSSGGYCCPWST